MKKFRFSLQRVLDVKVLLEEQQRLALAGARAATEAAQTQLERVRVQRAAAVREDGSDQFAEPWLRELSWRWRERLLARERQLAEELAQARRREEAERALLAARHKERLVLEKLAEKRRREYAVQLARWEQAVLDEAAAGRRHRLMAGGVYEQA